MDQNEQRLITDLFAKLKQAEEQSGPRDQSAEQAIADAVTRQPAAPYYMSQVILVQEQAVQAQNQRIQELEKQLAERPAGGGGFLGSLFGGASPASAAAPSPAARTPAGAAFGQTPAAAPGRGWSQPAGRSAAGGAAGGGFLASALTTAAGVAGGIMVANALTGLFSGDEAQAAEVPEAPADLEPTGFESDDAFMDDGGFEDFEEF
ncbi:hypothetical protein CKO25_15855 [Thiocapsa imhoffii]|uniref:DUF2076 domain-containing protein n=1 Tax=Thiocapsa imhoffii TaxID=382777 RepID=A0A9X0WKF3_9GAMM|nr:DUF2076 domain-containing protein [Thiocapsa imhoffii]MBK1646095.1 hypothetical protein [Thiocapsa imhoffii]